MEKFSLTFAERACCKAVSGVREDLITGYLTRNRSSTNR